MVKFKVCLLIFCLSGCATLMNRELPIIERVSPSATKKIAYVEYADPHIPMLNQKMIAEELIKSNQFSKVVFDEALVGDFQKKEPPVLKDFFPESSKNERWDIKLRIGLKSYAPIYHPYCFLTLAIIPCRPTVRWAVGMQALSRDGKVLGEYLVTEEATMTLWLFGFLLSGSGSTMEKGSELSQNILNHLFTKMRADGVL